ncbi:outer membrane protein [Sulfuriferula plumbiphila]|uniref:Outer membrane protein n=1 Tax=Sulfuriferula plumbiphila TaxID=171865 RepID=A0A512L919_9PROT|nr:TolC family outer membrane protein [Sulfuriferula plumbiphila]BBP04397.1 outer membrane protein [Sulfuriferula plumbiphila]GEP30986.1 outer membrane protein [Sulfuriferula plumbiphila]
MSPKHISSSLSRRGEALLVLFSLAWHPAHSADLLDIYRLAWHNDPSFEAARYVLQAAQEKVPQARASLLPAVSASGSRNYTQSSAAYGGTPPVDRDVRAWTWNVQLTQPLIRLQNIFAYSESQAIVKQATAQFAQAEQALILRVTQAYFDVVVAQESIAVAQAQVQAMQAQLAQAIRGFETGTHAVTDMHEARARHALAIAQQVSARNGLSNKQAELEKIIGQDIGVLNTLQPAVVIPKPQPNDAQTWIALARERNPAVLAQQSAVQAAEAKVSRNRAEHLPTLDLTASHGKNHSSGTTLNPTNYATSASQQQLGVQLTLPLFSGAATSSRISEAIASRCKSQAELEAARRQAATDARQAYAGIENGLAQIEALQSAVKSSQSAVKGNQAGFGVGIRMNIDVLNAEQQLYSAQRDLAKARYDTLLQGLKLKAAAGALSEDDVLTVNALLGSALQEQLKN